MIKHDTRVDRVLFSKKFWDWGREAIMFPKNLNVNGTGIRNYKYDF